MCTPPKKSPPPLQEDSPRDDNLYAPIHHGVPPDQLQILEEGQGDEGEGVFDLQEARDGLDESQAPLKFCRQVVCKGPIVVCTHSRMQSLELWGSLKGDPTNSTTPAGKPSWRLTTPSDVQNQVALEEGTASQILGCLQGVHRLGAHLALLGAETLTFMANDAGGIRTHTCIMAYGGDTRLAGQDYLMGEEPI